MSMKRILGMMLASRMAGRGMRGRGGLAGGGLGTLAAAGLLGGRRGGLGRKAGLAALGYMAYRAYQDHQSRTAAGTQGASQDRARAGAAGGSASGSGAAAGGLGDLIGGVMKSVGDALGGTGTRDETRGGGASPFAEPPAAQAFTAEDERAAEALGEDKALLLLRAMITAANADGQITSDERSRILSQAEDADDRRTLERELAAPRPLEELLGQVRDRETAEEFYLSSRMAVDADTGANRAYLDRLRARLGLAERDAAEIDALAAGPA